MINRLPLVRTRGVQFPTSATPIVYGPFEVTALSQLLLRYQPRGAYALSACLVMQRATRDECLELRNQYLSNPATFQDAFGTWQWDAAVFADNAFMNSIFGPIGPTPPAAPWQSAFIRHWSTPVVAPWAIVMVTPNPNNAPAAAHRFDLDVFGSTDDLLHEHAPMSSNFVQLGGANAGPGAFAFTGPLPWTNGRFDYYLQSTGAPVVTADLQVLRFDNTVVTLQRIFDSAVSARSVGTITLPKLPARISYSFAAGASSLAGGLVEHR